MNTEQRKAQAMQAVENGEETKMDKNSAMWVNTENRVSGVVVEQTWVEVKTGKTRKERV